MKIISVRLKANSYNIYIGKNSIKGIPAYIKKTNLGNFAIIITSSKIYSLYKSLITSIFPKSNCKIIKVADGEIAKSQKCLLKVLEEVIKADGLNKRLFIACIGGGVVGDLGGFVASIYKRGIPYIQIPTTLLSQIDSSIGGKTAINIGIAKNIVGSFYQPKAVFIDPSFLKTLPKKELKQGLAEAIKYGIISNKSFFYFLKRNKKKIMDLNYSSILRLISTCIRIKADIVSKDELERKGLRTILNFGHTLAHAIEGSSAYTKITHGEAVAIGMIYAAKLSLYLKKCNQNDLSQIENLINLYSLPTKTNIAHSAIHKSLCYDKKFISGQIRMVLLQQIGKVTVVEGISSTDIKKTLKNFTLP